MEKDFNFFNKKKQTKEIVFKKQNPHRPYIFLKMGAAALFVAGLTGGYLYFKGDNFVEEQVKIVQSTPIIQVENLMLREEKIINSNYEQNKRLLAQYSNYTQIMKALNYDAKYQTKYNANEQIFKESFSNINRDRKVIDLMTDKTQTKESKKVIFSNPENLKIFKSWTDSNAYRQYIYAYQSIELQADIKKDLDFLEKTQKEINTAVANRLKL